MSTDGISLSLNTTSSRHEVNMDDLRALVVSQNTKQPTDAEMYVFKRLCESLGANPFLRDIHIVKYSETSPASFITGKDFFTKVARSQNATWESGILVVRQGESQETKLIGTFMLPTDSLVGGWADVHTKDGTMPTTVLLSDFDTGKSLWAKMPGTMIEKCAIVKALRMAYPDKFSGAYSAEEMAQADKFKDVDLIQDIESIDKAQVSTPLVQHAESLGAEVVDVKPKVEKITATVEPVITSAKPQVLSEPTPPESILCPIHNEEMGRRDGNYGIYYSHMGPNEKWCNCNYDKPKLTFQTEWAKAIEEAHGASTAERVKSNAPGQTLIWWMAQLAGEKVAKEVCMLCDADGEVEIESGVWTCIEHEEEYRNGK